MQKNLFSILFIFFTFSILAQSDSLNQEVSPIGGIDMLALEYYRIDFSKEQRGRLKDVLIEFIYKVDEKGNPTLEEINGINDRDIVDSLEARSVNIPKFYPRIVNGTSQSSLYFMQTGFPSYKLTRSKIGLMQSAYYREASIEDFEYIKKSNQRVDILFGASANQFIGSPSDYLSFGGGMKIGVDFTTKKRLILGFNMTFFGNKLKQDFPVEATREQNSAPPTLFSGVTIGKWFDKFSVQLELDFVVQNITEKLAATDPGWVQFNGWSPGLVINYPIKIGKDRSFYYYGSPTIFNNMLNLHLGFRPLFMDVKEASGAMLEVGVSYRMTCHMVSDYKFKEEFLKKY